MKAKHHFFDWASVAFLSLIVMIVTFFIPWPFICFASVILFIISTSVLISRRVDRIDKESGGSIFDDYGYL